MFRPALSLLLLLATSACTGIIQVPVTGTLGEKTPVSGVVTARTDSALGRYAVQTADKSVTCNGVYDASSIEPRMIVAVSCDDGRYGAVDVRRSPDLMSGTGTGKLNDGTPFRVLFNSPKD